MKERGVLRFLNWEILLLFIFSLTPFLWVGNGWIILGHDSGFRVQIWDHMKHLWETWNPAVNMGTDWSIYKGFLVIQLPELIFQTLFGSLEKAQPFILSFWFFVMAIGMYVAMRGFFPEKKYWFLRLYASFFWVFNFYILQAWFIAERAKFSLYAALPLAFYLIVSTFEKKRPVIISAILFGFLYFLCNGGGSPPLYGATFVVWGITFIWYSIKEARRDGIHGLWFSGKTIFVFLLFFFLFNAYWIVLQIGLVRGSYSSAVADQGGIEGLIAWEREISKFASIPNLLRLQGFPDWYGNQSHPYASSYITNPIFIGISFLPVFIILGGIIISVFKKQKFSQHLSLPLLFVFLAVGLFFAAGSHPPTGPIYLFFMRKVPGFAIFRSSFFKFAPVVWFSIIVLSGYYLSLFLEKVKGRPRTILVVIILGGILLYHYPFFTTKFFQFDPFFTTRVKIPPYVRNVSSYLDKEKRSGRVLIMPRLDTGFINKPIDTYTWGYYSLDLLPRISSKRSFVANDSPDFTVTLLYNAIDGEDKEKATRLAQLLGITDILYRGDVKQSKKEETTRPKKDEEAHLTRLFGSSVFNSGEWKVFHIQDTLPTAFTTSDIVAIRSSSLHDAVLSETRTTIIRTNDTAFPSFAVEAECFSCESYEYNQFLSSITIPQPNGKLTNFIRKIRKPKQLPPSDSPAYLDILLSRAQEALGNLEYQRYQSLLLELRKHWGNLHGRDRVIYTNRLYAFAIKQQEFLTAHNSSSPSLADFLKELKRSLWVSDNTSYRYGIEIPENGVYKWIMNGKQEKTGETATLASGFFLFEVPRTSGTSPPILFLKTVTPPDKQSFKPSGVPAVFVSPTEFDKRWNLRDLSHHVLSHVLVNGYANGWILPTGDGVGLSLSYAPNQAFLVGVLISVVSLLGGIIVVRGQRKYL